ncbi:MAG: hypothetical protein R2939_21780 [Kofleriaceae bacterium]
MAELTFRDFAGAHMQGDDARAATVLETLLGVSSTTATAATAHFRAAAAREGGAFMAKAMGLRAAVEAADPVAIRATLTACFGLVDDDLAQATATLAPSARG